MLSPTFFVLAASLLAELATSASTPTCISSAEGYPVGQVDYLFNNFCSQLASNNFATQQQIYGLPVISFDFIAASSSDPCNLDNCLASYQTLVTSCKLPNSTIWGTGSLDAGCGVYNYTIWNTAINPVTLGAPTTTLQGATMTTAPIITATSWSTTTSSSTSLSVSSATSTSTSTSTSCTATVTESPIPQLPIYSNGTSYASVSSFASGSGSVISRTVGATQASTTKPLVGSTSLATSGADVLRVSGFSLVAVACMFGWYF
ncbi:hypothetical protein EG329_009296 [Mollisiaceae sp. DMI_Dod_QoI]|nr:hypothetical protein EG329_009296 [Helotiales sp. DMI_Dod_QoI]